MKVLVCGKGGCGKSTIVALLSKEMAERKNKVLVIDSDVLLRQLRWSMA